jgi:D-tyrosyl-tRNA(Tyr) deacylase
MKVVIQRVKSASVEIDEAIKSSIAQGLLVLAGFEEADTLEDLDWLSKKIAQLRIFNDSAGLMNLSVKDVGGEILVVSQFTLHASTKKGNRPSFIKAAKPDIAIPLYNAFVKSLEAESGKPVKTGEFGADMKVSLVNDGPVTIVIDTKSKE